MPKSSKYHRHGESDKPQKCWTCHVYMDHLYVCVSAKHPFCLMFNSSGHGMDSKCPFTDLMYSLHSESKRNVNSSNTIYLCYTTNSQIVAWLYLNHNSITQIGQSMLPASIAREWRISHLPPLQDQDR